MLSTSQRLQRLKFSQGRHHLTISEGIKDASIMHDAETQRFQWYQSVLEYEGSLDASFILTGLVPDLETASSTLDRALILEVRINMP